MSARGEGGTRFLLAAIVYAVVVALVLVLTAPGMARDGLAALPVMTLTLPTSAILMMSLARLVPQIREVWV
jgi:hypothetical protein